MNCGEERDEEHDALRVQRSDEPRIAEQPPHRRRRDGGLQALPAGERPARNIFTPRNSRYSPPANLHHRKPERRRGQQRAQAQQRQHQRRRIPQRHRSDERQPRPLPMRHRVADDGEDGRPGMTTRMAVAATKASQASIDIGSRVTARPPAVSILPRQGPLAGEAQPRASPKRRPR